MKYQPLGKTGISASAISLGTSAIGEWVRSSTSEIEAIKLMHESIAREVSMIDTDPMYGAGYSEELIGKAIRGKRDKVIIASKCGIAWADNKTRFFSNSLNGLKKEEIEKNTKISLAPESIRRELEQSLFRMKITCIDLYYMKCVDPLTPPELTMQELMKLKRAGKIRAIGLCNPTTDQLDKYRKYGDIDAVLSVFNMLDRDAERNLFQYCMRNNIAFVARFPHALGILTAKMEPETVFKDDDIRKNSPRFTPENIAHINNMLSEFHDIAVEHNVNIAQLVLGWTLKQPGCTHLVADANTIDEAIANARAGTIQLSSAEFSKMKAYLKTFEPFMPLVEPEIPECALIQNETSKFHSITEQSDTALQ